MMPHHQRLARKAHPAPGARINLTAQLTEVQARLTEAEQTLEAIRTGGVDALIVHGPDGSERVFSIEGAETPYRSLVEEINEGALLLHANGTILYANARFAQLAERPLEQVIGSACDGFFASPEHGSVESLFSAARAGSPRKEFFLQSRTGQRRPVEVSLSLLKGGQAETFSAIVTDLTERKVAEEALRLANEQLEARVLQRTLDLTQANESLQAAEAKLQAHAQNLERAIQERTAKLHSSIDELHHVSYAMVHDMRAPLRALRGFAELIEESCAACPQLLNHQYHRRIIVAAERLDDLITDALHYTKILNEEPPLQPVDVAKLIGDLIQTYPNLLPDKADIQIQGPLPPVLGNESYLTQCFSNLLGNAVKFVRPGLRPQIRIWAEEEAVEREASGALELKPDLTSPEALRSTPATVCLWVADNGIGIPREVHHRLFGMFQKLHSDYEGTGIGLAIVRKVVQRMGGEVGVESDEGQGSRFWVRLRAAAAGGSLTKSTCDA